MCCEATGVSLVEVLSCVLKGHTDRLSRQKQVAIRLRRMGVIPDCCAARATEFEFPLFTAKRIEESLLDRPESDDMLRLALKRTGC